MPTYQLNLFSINSFIFFSRVSVYFRLFRFAVQVCPNEWRVLFLSIYFLLIWNKISKILKI